MFEGHPVVALFDVAFTAEAGEQTADGFAGETSHAAELFVGEFEEEGDREIGAGGCFNEVIGAGEVEEGTCEFASGGGVEGEAASGEDGAVVLAGQGESDDTVDVGMIPHEADEVAAWDGFYGGGAKGFGADAVDGVIVQGCETEDIAGAGDSKEKKPAFAGGSGGFYAAVADDVEVAGREALAEEDFVRLVVTADAYGVKIVQRVRGEGGRDWGAWR
jgi:hypothetical protein